MKLLRVLRSLLIDYDAPLTDEWRKAYAAESLKTGWDGPRWRTPAERAQMQRQERRAALRVVPSAMRRVK